MRKFIIILLFITVKTIFSQEIAVPIVNQIPIMYKILSYDRSFTKNIRGNLKFTIFYQKSYRYSLVISKEILSTIQGNETFQRFSGYNVQIEAVSIQDENDIDRYLNKNITDCAIIAPLRSVDISNISEILIQHKMMSFSVLPEYVDFGVAFGLGIKGEKPLIIINLITAKEIHAEFSSQILKFSKVIE